MTLDGLLVVEIGDAASGRLAARMLSDHGARVVRIAAPDEPGDEADALFLDAGKEVVRLPYTHPEVRRLLVWAASEADVLIETLPPGAIEELGLDREATQALICSVTPFGQSGPRADWRGSELVLQAYGGFLTLSGDPSKAPVKAALDQVEYTGGRVAAFAVLASLLAGSAKPIDVALAEVAATLPPFHVQQYTHTGLISGRGPEIEPALDGQHVPTMDGAVTFATGNTPPELFAVLFDDDRLLDDRFHTPLRRMQHREELAEIVHASAARHTSRQLLDRALELDIVAGIVQSPREILDCPHLAERGALPALGGTALRMPGSGFRSPDLGQRQPVPPREVSVSDLLSHARTEGPRAGSPGTADERLPLAGLRVLTFEDVIALPWATAQLAALGATVVRIESRTRLQGRHWGAFPANEPGDQWWNSGANLCHLYRRKRSVALDLRDARGASAARALAAGADLLLENFRPGVMERLGLDDDALREANAGLTIVHCSGFGRDGRYAGMGAFARTIDAMSGLSDLTGYPDGPPLRANPSYMDMVSAWNIAAAAMIGLHAGRRLGRGVTIDHSMYEAGVSTAGPAILREQLGVPVGRRRGNAGPRYAPQGVYRCAANRYIAISVADDAQWRALARAADRGWESDDRLGSHDGRAASAGALDAMIGEWTEGCDTFELEQLLQDRGVAASVVRDARDVVVDRHLRERGFFEWITTPGDSEPGDGEQGDRYVRPYPGSPFSTGRTSRNAAAATAPRLGEHSHELLRAAGFDGASLEALERDGVTGTRPVEGVAGTPRPIDATAAIARATMQALDERYEAVVADFAASVSP